jgi:hypothetical protein
VAGGWGLLLEGEDFVPVVFHTDDGPAFGVGFVEGFVEFTDQGCAVIGVLASGVGVVDEKHETWAEASGCSLKHLLVAVGVAEGGNGALADVVVNADGLAGAVVEEIKLRQAHDDRDSVLRLELGLHAGAHDLFGRDAVRFVGPGAHELDLAAGDDEGLEAVGAEIGKELDHRFVDELSIGVVEAAVAGPGDPVGDGLLELFIGHAGAGRDDQLVDALLAGGEDCFHIAFEDALEGLFCLPLGMLGGHLPDTVEGEDELGVERRLDPERAVVVEGGDAVGDGDEVRRALFGDALDEGDDGFFGSGIIPGGKRVLMDLLGRWGLLDMVLILTAR